MKEGKETRILYVALSTGDDRWRRVQERELKEIDGRLKAGSHRNDFELIPELNVQARDLQEILLRHQPHIVHLSGQGTKEGGIVLAHNSGSSHIVDGRALAELFRILKDNIRVLIFNTYHTQQPARELLEITDYTVSMRGAGDGENAIIFFTHFYQGLSYERTIADSFELGKNQLKLEGKDDYKKAVLHVRNGAGAARPMPEPWIVRRPAKAAKIVVAGTA